MPKIYLMMLFAAVSGGLWGAIGYVLGFGWFQSAAVGGVIASPGIGVLIGLVAWPTRGWWWPVHAVMACVVLYAGVMLFALAMGMYDLIAYDYQTMGVFEKLLKYQVYALSYITVYGFVLVLWPMMYLNLRLVFKLDDGDGGRGGGGAA